MLRSELDVLRIRSLKSLGVVRMLLCTSGTVVGVIVDVHAHGYELCSVAQAMWSHSVSDFAHFPPKFCVSTPTEGSAPAQVPHSYVNERCVGRVLERARSLEAD